LTKRPEIIELAAKGLLERALQSVPTPDFAQAVCAGKPLDLFFSDEPSETLAAKALCAECPIRVQCAQWAGLNAPYGVFGGMTPDERRILFGIDFDEMALTREELLEQYNFIQNMTAREVGLRFGVDARTVVRWRTVLRSMKEVA
jgi:predicted RecB family nuclease